MTLLSDLGVHMYINVELEDAYTGETVIRLKEWVESDEAAYNLLDRILQAEKALRKPFNQDTSDDTPF